MVENESVFSDYDLRDSDCHSLQTLSGDVRQLRNLPQVVGVQTVAKLSFLIRVHLRHQICDILASCFPPNVIIQTLHLVDFHFGHFVPVQMLLSNVHSLPPLELGPNDVDEV